MMMSKLCLLTLAVQLDNPVNPFTVLPWQRRGVPANPFQFSLDQTSKESSSNGAAMDPREALYRAMREVSLKTDPQFADPTKNEGNFVSPFEAQQLLQQQTPPPSPNEGQENDAGRIPKSSSQPQLMTDDDLGVVPSPLSLGDDQDGPLINGVELDSDDYMQLSQYVGGQDPLRDDGGAGDGYNSVLNRALSKDQRKDRGQEIIKRNEKRYRLVLKSITRPAPQSPDAVKAKGKQPPTVNDLMSAWQQASILKNRTSAQLHQQVFQDEQGFLKQSKLFRESLTNSSKTREVMAKRHAAAYEARQTKAQTRLEKQMEEMQAILQTSQQYKCPTCQCIMSQEAWETQTKEYKGQLICDVCYAEKRFVQRVSNDAPMLKPRWQSQPRYMTSSFSPDQTMSSAFTRGGSMRRRFGGSDSTERNARRDGRDAPGMPSNNQSNNKRRKAPTKQQTPKRSNKTAPKPKRDTDNGNE